MNEASLKMKGEVSSKSDLVRNPKVKRGEEWCFYKRTPHVSFCAWQWQIMAPVMADYCPSKGQCCAIVRQ